MCVHLAQWTVCQVPVEEVSVANHTRSDGEKSGRLLLVVTAVMQAPAVEVQVPCAVLRNRSRC